MGQDNALGDYLRTRRAHVAPETVGLRPVGSRRTPGLRREELAGLAGISVEYLIRLERGRDRHPSPAVVSALSAVLQLDDDARAHLAALADVRPEPPEDNDEVSPVLAATMESWTTPAMVMNRFLDVLALNAAGVALHDDLGLRPGVNNAREFFLDPVAAHEHFPDHDEIADELVANLRSSAGGEPDHPRLISLVGELSLASKDFAERWARADVQAKTDGRKRIRHPVVGEIELMWTSLHVAAAPNQLLVAYRAEPGTVHERRLADLTLRARQTG